MANTDPQKGKQFQRRRSIIRDFSLNTTTHGLPGIARSESVLNRIFWSVALLTFTGVMIYFIAISIRDFFEYPTQTKVIIDSEWPQYFPAVTLCNASPVRLDLLGDQLLNFTRTFNLTNITDLRTMSETQADYINDFFRYQINNGETISDAYFSLESMLMDCRYNEITCSAEDFIPFVSAVYGHCYTFNAKMKGEEKSSVRYNHLNGGIGKLEMILYAHSHQYVPYLREGSGIVAMLHDNIELPQIDVAGMKMAPGFHHKLAFSKKSLVTLASPYSDCTSAVSPVMEAVFDAHNGGEYGYSQDCCFTLCEQSYLYDQCGCVSPFSWNARFVVPANTNKIISAPICARTDQCYREARERLLSDKAAGAAYCSSCTPQCSTTTFNIKPSAFAGPSYWRLDEIKNFVENSSTVPLSEKWESDWQNEIRANFVGIEVILESTLVEKYTQEPSVSSVELLSNVGGQTGLWIGMSFLSLVEVAEMLYRLIRSQIHQFVRSFDDRTRF